MGLSSEAWGGGGRRAAPPTGPLLPQLLPWPLGATQLPLPGRLHPGKEGSSDGLHSPDSLTFLKPPQGEKAELAEKPWSQAKWRLQELYSKLRPACRE